MAERPGGRGDEESNRPSPAQLSRLSDLLLAHPQVAEIQLRWEEYRGASMVTAYVVAADPFVVPRLDRLRGLVPGGELRPWMPRRLKLVRSLTPWGGEKDG